MEPTEENKSLFTDHDTHWKDLISRLFWDFLSFFMPDLYAEVDQSRGFEFLDKELHKLVADKFKQGTVEQDKLAKVWLKNGEEQWILIHIEVQSYFETDFAKRMFVYYYRLYDNYEQEITAIAIYTGDAVPQNYQMFKHDFFGTEIKYQFNTYLVRDQEEKDLINSENPFALAVLAAKYWSVSKKDLKSRYRYKIRLIRLLIDSKVDTF